MALADRRPLDFPMTSTTASPTFDPQSLNDLKSRGFDTGDENDVFDQEFEGEFDQDNDEDLDMDQDPDQESYGGSPTEPDQSQDRASRKELVKNLTPETSLSPGELSPTSRSISPDSLMNLDLKSHRLVPTSESSRGSTPPAHLSLAPANRSQSHSGTNSVKKPKNTSRVPIATGISTTIPVTGEKPKPDQKDDPSLEDDVLYAIFLILYEKDPEGKGMTVKQICDVLIDRHPEMANLSSKTSNLVSAKLNAYVKRVEKGDSSLKYALSRDWADASPKRMVYVYRGLLTDDFHVHVKNMMEVQKQEDMKNAKFNHSDSSLEKSKPFQSSTNSMSSNSTSNDEFDSVNGGDADSLSSFEAGKQASLKPRRQTMYDLGINRHSFLSNSIDKSNLFVPYNSAPVTASLQNQDRKPDVKTTDSTTIGQTKTESSNDKKDSNDMDVDEDHEAKDLDFEVFDANDQDPEQEHEVIETFKKNGKRSKSMSYLTNKKHKILTAAAAAPRAPKTPCSHSPTAAAAAAALHAAAIKAINYETGNLSSSHDLIKCHHNKKWVNVIRSGFFAQDIGTPEDISLSDLDKFFN